MLNPSYSSIDVYFMVCRLMDEDINEVLLWVVVFIEKEACVPIRFVSGIDWKQMFFGRDIFLQHSDPEK